MKARRRNAVQYSLPLGGVAGCAATYQPSAVAGWQWLALPAIQPSAIRRSRHYRLAAAGYGIRYCQ